MKGLRIYNCTDWCTNDLRAICAMALKERGQEGLGVIFLNGRRIHGRAHYPGNWYFVDPKRGNKGGWAKIKMWLPKPPEDPEPAARFGDAKKAELGRVLLHEIDHTLGLKHGEMANLHKFDASWIESMILRRAEKKPVRPKPSIEERRDARVAKREGKARTKLVEWQRKLKTAQRKVREYQRKARYYDKRREVASRKEWP